MVKRMIHNNKARYSLIVLLAGTLLLVGMVTAYMQSKTSNVTNAFKAGEITTTIEEDDPKVVGTSIEKEPFVKNHGPEDCLVRARINISPGEIADYLNNGDGSINFSDMWKLNPDDGFYYYQGVLKAGESTKEPVFDEITGLTDSDGKIIEDFRDIEGFDISIYQEAVQAEALLTDDDGNEVYKYAFRRDNDGNYIYESDVAMEIWGHYDKESAK